ncbi:MAG: 1-acyl-sn-glycerol-3-phosphate acyltransferase [Clostridia bacterium]|nr:1-acyl-sn-glycerol-3-phosphate acyltransferase [Clostridia bacterium]
MEHINVSEHAHNNTVAHAHHGVKPVRQSTFFYLIARAASFVVSRFIFKKKTLRNEIRGKRGPFVVIANHQAAYDFVNLIGATSRKMTFVISESFYNSVPVKGVIKRMGVIPKQQFQTGLKDIKAMKAAVDSGRILTLYPAGLMCEDGLSTPIPQTTYKFLQWLKCDVYMARTYGTYFSMPKWTKGLRSGKTYMDIYKLFSKEELETLDECEIKRRADEALLFDAYREQEHFMVKYKNGSNIEGLENVLYMCPHCKSEFSMHVRDRSVLWCDKCGFAHKSDDYGFLHNVGDGEEIRYVSDISKMTYDELSSRIASGDEGEVTLNVRIQQIVGKGTKFSDVGEGSVTLTKDHFYISGTLNGEAFERSIPILTFASLPFSPGKYFEIQHSEEIFRCIPDDTRQVMKFINKVKIFHELAAAEHERACHK